MYREANRLLCLAIGALLDGIETTEAWTVDSFHEGDMSNLCTYGRCFRGQTSYSSTNIVKRRCVATTREKD